MKRKKEVNTALGQCERHREKLHLQNPEYMDQYIEDVRLIVETQGGHMTNKKYIELLMWQGLSVEGAHTVLTEIKKRKAEGGDYYA